MTLPKFQDNFLAKIFIKHRGGIKIKTYLFIGVFEVSNNTLWVGLPSLRGDQPLLDSEFCVGGVDAP